MEWYWIVLIVLGCISVLIGGLYLFLIWPGNPKKCGNCSWLYKKPIAHRGYYNNKEGIIENSISAFKRAIEKGYNIEFDINITKDNKVIIYHDDTFRRMFHLYKNVYDLTLSEIKELRYENSDDEIIELKDLLKLVKGKVGLVVEFKASTPENNARLVKEAMKHLIKYDGDYVVQSFDPRLVKLLKDQYPYIPRGQLYFLYNLKYEWRKVKNIKTFVSFITKWLYNNKLTNFLSRPIFFDHDHRKVNNIMW